MTPVHDRRDESLLSFLKSRLFDQRAPEYSLLAIDEEIQELGRTTLLSLSFPRHENRVPAPAVEMGETIVAGQLLAAADDRWRSPVAGEVVGLRSLADLRGGRPGLTVLIEPADTDATEPSLDPVESSVADLRARLHAMAAKTDEAPPGPLLELLPASSHPQAELIVLAADREPWLTSKSQLLRERSDDLIPAVRMLARIGGFERIRVAVLDSMTSVLPDLAASAIETLSLEPVYPQTHDRMLLLSSGRPGSVVIGLEAALAALDIVRLGKPQSTKIVTVIGPDGQRHGNFRVPIGTRLQDLLAALDLHVDSQDKVVAGGPMGGWAQFSLETSIDHGVDGVLLLRGKEVRTYSDEPCINCGSCIDSCPAGLQAQHLARYSEFGLFDQARDHRLDDCFECGLCATVCPARRPMLQWIRLAKRELSGVPRTGVSP